MRVGVVLVGVVLLLAVVAPRGVHGADVPVHGSSAPRRVLQLDGLQWNIFTGLARINQYAWGGRHSFRGTPINMLVIGSSSDARVATETPFVQLVCELVANGAHGQAVLLETNEDMLPALAQEIVTRNAETPHFQSRLFALSRWPAVLNASTPLVGDGFDLVVAQGLERLPLGERRALLRRVANVTRDGAAMVLTAPSAVLQADHAAMHDMLTALGAREGAWSDAHGVGVVRDLVTSLPTYHPLHMNTWDAEKVWASYKRGQHMTVAQVVHLLADFNFTAVHALPRVHYDVSVTQTALAPATKDLDWLSALTFSELAMGVSNQHWVYAVRGHAGDAMGPRALSIEPSAVPLAMHGLVAWQASPHTQPLSGVLMGKTLRLSRVTPVQRAMLSLVDGRRTVGDILGVVRAQPAYAGEGDLLRQFVELFGELSRVDAMCVTYSENFVHLAPPVAGLG